MDVRLVLEKQIKEAIAATGHKAARLEKPPAGIDADFAFPCFDIARQEKRNPVEIARSLAARIKKPELVAKVEASGPYINFHADMPKIAQLLLERIDSKYGRGAEGKKAVIDFSSPNPVHPFHLGTLRSTLIGESVARILEFAAWRVKRVCYINDIGKQAAALILAYQRWDGKPKKGQRPYEWLGELYAKISRETDEKTETAAYDILREYERGEKKVRALGKKVFSMALADFKKDWAQLGVRFDHIVWENRFVTQSKELIKTMKKKEMVFESKDALVLDLERLTNGELPSTIILRADGTGLYLTRDIPFALWKQALVPDIDLNLYVTGEDQAMHFKQLFKTLELLGHKRFSSVCRHLSYALVTLEGKKMSARAGRYVLWNELFAEGKKKAAEEVRKRWPELGKAAREKRAEQIALGAIAFFMLRYSPEKIVDFRWKEALAFEGATGPYLQYTHARARSILDKAGKAPKKFHASALRDAHEIKVIRKLMDFPSVVHNAAESLQPHILAAYVYELAEVFNEFYQAVRVLQAENERLKAARLALVRASAEVLKTGLGLLAIPAPEKM